MKTVKISKQEEEALNYTKEFLYNAFLEHKDDSIGKQIKPELKSLLSLIKKIKSAEVNNTSSVQKQNEKFNKALSELRTECPERMKSLNLDKIRFFSHPTESFQFLENYKPIKLKSADRKYFEKLMKSVGIPLLKKHLVDFQNTKLVMNLFLSSFPNSITFDIGFIDGDDEFRTREVNIHNGNLEPDWDAIIEEVEKMEGQLLPPTTQS